AAAGGGAAAASGGSPRRLHLAHLRLHPAAHLLELHHPPVHPVEERPEILALQRQVEPPGVQDDLAAGGDEVVVVLAAGAVLRRGHRPQVFVRAAAAEEALEHRVLRRQRLHRRPRRESGVPGEVLAALRRELLVVYPLADPHLLLLRQPRVNLP
ncbi:Os07g0546501, partial [Oryza sativa Japonica Group]